MLSAANLAAMIDPLDAPAFLPVVIVDGRTDDRTICSGAITVCVDAVGDCPPVDHRAYDILLTSRREPPAPWVQIDRPREEAQRIADKVATFPVASRILLELLRMQREMNATDAVLAESLAYSTLLGSGEFARWLGRRRVKDGAHRAVTPLILAREGDAIRLTLSDPATRNAMSAGMRDALYDVLTNIVDDPTRPTVTITASGKCFSVGGHLPEFGSNRDLAAAHAIRTDRTCVPLLANIGQRATVIFHGAVIGSGLEVFAASGHRWARPGTWFQLPELAMGLIPGAGGTRTVTKAIGRQRALWMMLSGRRIDACTAQSWGLIHRIVP